MTKKSEDDSIINFKFKIIFAPMIKQYIEKAKRDFEFLFKFPY